MRLHCGISVELGRSQSWRDICREYVHEGPVPTDSRQSLDLNAVLHFTILPHLGHTVFKPRVPQIQ